jgi:hypothetical protein
MSAAVVLDDKQFNKSLSGLENRSETAFKNIAAAAAGYLTFRAVGKFYSDAIKVYSDLEEATNKFNVVFQGMGKDTSRVLSELRREFGQSELSAKQMLSGTGDILTGFGFDRRMSLDLSEGTAKLAADLASFSNYAGGAKGASEALTKAMLGETEQAKMLGIVIRQDSEEYKELVRQAQTTGVTIDALGKTFKVSNEQQAKAVAALALAYKQSPNAIGDFARSQDSIANQTQILKNNLDELYSTIGKDLAGSYAAALQGSNALLKSYTDLSPATRGLLNETVALGAAIAIIGKTGALNLMNGAVGSIGKAFSGGGLAGVREKAEADAVAASEARKRAEYAKTDAFRESRAAAQSVRLAKMQVEEQNAAVMAAKLNFQKAQGGNDPAQLAAAQKELATAQNNLTKAQIAQSKAVQDLTNKHASARAATLQHTAAVKASDVALATSAKAATLAGRAQMVMAAGLNSVKAAASGLVAALGPVGIAMLALSGVYMLVNHAASKNRQELELQQDLARQRVDAVNEEVSNNERLRAEDDKRFSRLKELSAFERLNNSEKEEAQKIIQELSGRYKNLNIELDTTTGKILAQAGAWEELAKVQAAQARKDATKKANANQQRLAAEMIALRSNLGGFMENTVGRGAATWIEWFGGTNRASEGSAAYKLTTTELQKQFDQIMKLQTAEKQLSAFEKMRNTFIAEDDKERVDQVSKVIAALKDQVNLEKELEKVRKEGAKKGTPSGQIQEQSKAERAAAEALKNRQWELQFTLSDPDKQLAMLQEKIDKIFSGTSGKYANLDAFKTASGTDEGRAAMNASDLAAAKEILELEERRRQIREQSATAFEREQKAYKDLLSSEAQRAVARQKEEAFRTAKGKGQGDEFAKNELKKAQEAAKTLQDQYQEAVKLARADQIFTEEERRRVQELRSQIQTALSDSDKWRGRIDTGATVEQEARKSVGAWSVAELNALLATGNSPQEQTAKNTKTMVELQRRLLEKESSSGEITYE